MALPHRSTTSLALAALALAVPAAAHTRSTWRAKEFRSLGPSNPAAWVGPFTVGLPLSNWPAVEAALAARAAPSSPLYGAWLSQAVVNAMIAPDPAVRAASNSPSSPPRARTASTCPRR